MIKKLVNYDSDSENDVPNKEEKATNKTDTTLGKRKIDLSEVPLFRVSKLLKTVLNSDECVASNKEGLHDEDINWRPSTLEEASKSKNSEAKAIPTGGSKKLILSEPKNVRFEKPKQKSSEVTTLFKRAAGPDINKRDKTSDDEDRGDNSNDGEEEGGSDGENNAKDNGEKQMFELNPEEDPQFARQRVFFKKDHEAERTFNTVDEFTVLKEAKQRKERLLLNDGLSNVNIKEIDGNSLLNFDWKAYNQSQKIKKELNKVPKGLPPNKLQKTKHQLTYLAYEAISKEDEIEHRLAEQRMNSRNTNSKYGW